MADNASTDNTWAIACGLAKQLDYVRALHIPQKGRGRALRTAWLQSSASVVAYMDVDLSTDLDALLPLVAPLLTGHSDVAIGSRLAPGARVVRGPSESSFRGCYNFVLRTTLRNSFSDAQCGFKAVRTEVARQVGPSCRRQRLVFRHGDACAGGTERLASPRSCSGLGRRPWLHGRHGKTARDDLKGIARMMRAAARQGQLAPQRARCLMPGDALSPAGRDNLSISPVWVW